MLCKKDMSILHVLVIDLMKGASSVHKYFRKVLHSMQVHEEWVISGWGNIFNQAKCQRV